MEMENRLVVWQATETWEREGVFGRERQRKKAAAQRSPFLVAEQFCVLTVVIM